jgi:ABC-type transport system involved in cytochrome c biogenesis permease subunit
VPAVGRRTVTGVDQGGNSPSAYVTLSHTGQPLGTYLFTTMELDPQFRPIHLPQPVEVDGKKYDVQLRFAREYRPYTVHLHDFVHAKYTGTDVPKDFASEITLVDPVRGEERRVRISMNDPLRYGGETFFQSSFKRGDKTTVLQIVRNPGLVLPYAACTIAAIGLIIHLGMSLIRFLMKRGAATAKAQPRAPTIRESSPGAALGFPAAVALGCIVMLIYLANPREKKVDNLDLRGFASLPVSFDGRVVPFDSVARNGLKIMAGKETFYHDGEKVPPLTLLLQLFSEDKDSKDQPARNYKLFRINHPEVKTLLGLDPEKRYFSLADFMPKAQKFDEQFQKIRNLPRTQRTPYHDAMLDLGGRLRHYMRLSHIEDLHAAAPTTAGEDWKTLDEVFRGVQGGVTTTNPSAEAFVHIVRAYKQNDAQAFNSAVASYRAAVEKLVPKQTAKASFETWFNSFSPLFVCCVLYVLVLVLAAMSWLFWTVPLGRAAFLMLVITFIVHTIGIISRVYLSGRAPVTNLESSAIFIGWVVVLLGIILELIYRNALASVISSIVGFLALTIYINLAKDDTMKVLQAVLDTNFWLWTHVPAITIGYSATFLAWGLGVAYIILGIFTRKLDANLGKDLTRMIYGITCFAIIFSFIGTVLGGIWADQSWGRFWGWDPKENGAVMIVLANALLLHARWGGLARERGIACLAIFGGIITSWSWFGTNMLGVGLHSYGFMDTALIWLLIFVVSQLGLIVLANIPLHMWASHGSTTVITETRGRAAGLSSAADEDHPPTPKKILTSP